MLAFLSNFRVPSNFDEVKVTESRVESQIYLIFSECQVSSAKLKALFTYLVEEGNAF